MKAAVKCLVTAVVVLAVQLPTSVVAYPLASQLDADEFQQLVDRVADGFMDALRAQDERSMEEYVDGVGDSDEMVADDNSDNDVDDSDSDVDVDLAARENERADEDGERIRDDENGEDIDSVEGVESDAEEGQYQAYTGERSAMAKTNDADKKRSSSTINYRQPLPGDAEEEAASRAESKVNNEEVRDELAELTSALDARNERNNNEPMVVWSPLPVDTAPLPQRPYPVSKSAYPGRRSAMAKTDGVAEERSSSTFDYRQPLAGDAEEEAASRAETEANKEARPELAEQTSALDTRNERNDNEAMSVWRRLPGETAPLPQRPLPASRPAKDSMYQKSVWSYVFKGIWAVGKSIFNNYG